MFDKHSPLAMNSRVTSQLRCFSVLAAAVQATVDMASNHFMDSVNVPDVLFHQVIHHVRCDHEVALQHGHIAGSALRVTLQHGEAVLEVEIAPRGMCSVLLMQMALVA